SRRRHTRWPRDWSSDVCSSDLHYVDVSLGRFARLKRWIKRKLLHNFQTAYVDVLSRQQSAFNRHIINALAELADAQEQLGHALRSEERRVGKECRSPWWR